MESRKMVLKSLFMGNNGQTNIENTYGHGKKGGEDEMYGESNMEIYITVCKIDNE